MTTDYYHELTPTFESRRDWNLPTVLRYWAARQPDAIYLDCPEEGLTFTYSQMLQQAESIGKNMLHLGAEPGDRVIVMGANRSQFVRTWFATAVAGLVEVPINTAYDRDFLAHQIDTVKARWAVIEDTQASKFIHVALAASSIERFWVMDTGASNEAIDLLRAHGWEAEPWDRLAEGGPSDLPEVTPRQLAAVFFTSGTTGASKGVAMPHAQMYFFADETRALTRCTSRDTWMTVTPLFHGNAQFMAAYPALVAGARVVIRSKFSASRWVDQLRESQVTITNLIGVMMDFIWKQAPRADDAENTLRCVFSAPTASSILEPMRKRFGIESFVEVFGLTETSAPILSPYGVERPSGAAGLAAEEFFDVRLVDPETDEEVPVGDIGELVVRPRSPWIVSLGYFNMPDKTSESWRNLWFHTGDALRRDAAGWYYFVDRFKDALRRRGENISSYEVETSILGHPSVYECAVMGVPAPGVEAGEDEVLAYIIADPQLTPEEVWAWCDERIPDFAVPRFLRFVEELPKTPSQRVQKAKLRALGITEDVHDRLR